MGQLDGKVALVTGGAHGIGAGIATCFALEGATVVVADLDIKVARALSEGGLLAKNHGFALELDVTSDASVQAVVKETLEKVGRVDILVNNAGIAGEIGDPFLLNTPDNWLKVYNTNTVSMERTVRALWNNFTTMRSGRIINIASIVAHGHGELKMKPAYNASKAGVIALTKVLAIQLAPYNVTVNSISPGLLFTGFWQHLGEQLKEKRPEQYPPGTETYDVFLKRVKELVPLGRQQHPHDIGWAAVFLASDRATNITGIDVPVDGGVLAR
ncbi:MAG TPA: SDR family oxidoreductase [Candidatus Paceibacterota bacterium]